MPDWLRNVIPRKAEEHLHFGLRTSYSLPNNAFVHSILDVRKGNAGSRKLFMVCMACNTGWMKALQVRTKPLLMPLIQGRWDEFDAERAAQIAVWMAMTVAVIAMSYRDTRGVTQQERSFILKRQAVPPAWTIWLGRGSGFEDITYSNRVASVFEASSADEASQKIFNPPEPNATVTTIGLGQLLLHAVTLPFADAAPEPIAYGRHFGVFPIHPWGGDALDWRWIPVLRADSPEFNELKDGFYNRVLNVPIIRGNRAQF